MKFACLLLSESPNAVAVVVPARQAYSHWASVGRRNSQPCGSSPARRADSVRSRQNASAPAKLTLPTGNSSPSGSSAVGLPGSVPTTRFQSPCVTSYFPAQKPRVSVTSTRVSSGRRSGSPGGLPIVNLPGGHQQSLIPPIVRSSPALVPSGSSRREPKPASATSAVAIAIFPMVTSPAGVTGQGLPRASQGKDRAASPGSEMERHILTVVRQDWRQNNPAEIKLPRGKLGQGPRGRDRYAPNLDKDGRFRIDDVSPGSYELS